MNKERDDIPFWTWLNGQFLFQIQEELERNPKKTISEFFNDFCNEPYPGSDKYYYHTKNQGTLIILLYGLLVVPKEIWGKTEKSFPFKTKEKFTFNPPTEANIRTSDFLRLFRNSIAHANFSLDINTEKWTFWNTDREKIKNFEVSLIHSDLALFMTEIGKYYLNDVRPRPK